MIDNLTRIFFFLALSTNSLCAQGSQTINAFHPEKDYSGDKIREIDQLSAVELIKEVLHDFDLVREKEIALLINGQYEARVHGNGDFDQTKTVERLNKKIILGAIERIEARYDLNYNDPWNTMPYTGTINFIIPALSNPNLDPNAQVDPEPWENPMTKRLIAAQEPDTRIKHALAKSSTGVGLFAGRQFTGESIFVGVPVEVPLTKNLSLYSSIMLNRKSYDLIQTDSFGFIYGSQNVERAVEASVMAKYYVNNTYPRFYGIAGPYVERDRLKQTYYDDPETGKFGKAHTAVGLNFGAGIVFHSQLSLQISWSTIFTSPDKLLPYQKKRGTTISVGWMFMKK